MAWRGDALCQEGGIVPGDLPDMRPGAMGQSNLATRPNLPTAAPLYGGSKLIFAAKEAVEKKAVARGIQIGREEGREEGKAEGSQEERERIRQELAAAGLHLTPEQERVLSQNGR